MAKRYRAVQAERVAEMGPRQLEVLVTRGLFQPEHSPADGQQRHYTESDIVRLAILSEVSRFGVPATKSAEIVRQMIFLKQPFALVIFHGFLELVPTSKRGEPPPPPGGPNAVYVRPNGPDYPLSWDVVELPAVSEFIASPKVAAAIVVPIDRIEARVKDRLNKIAAAAEDAT